MNIKSLHSDMKRCIVTKDLTPRQRETNKLRRQAKKSENKDCDRQLTSEKQVSDESDYNEETVLDITSSQSQNMLLMKDGIMFTSHSAGKLSPFSDVEDRALGGQLQDSILNCSAIVQNME